MASAVGAFEGSGFFTGGGRGARGGRGGYNGGGGGAEGGGGGGDDRADQEEITGDQRDVMVQIKHNDQRFVRLLAWERSCRHARSDAN